MLFFQIGEKTAISRWGIVCFKVEQLFQIVVIMSVWNKTTILQSQENAN